MHKILYVDDASSMRKLVDMVLGKSFDLTLCENGQEALEAIEKTQFEAILSDINMPVMDGFEFLEKLRAHPDYKFTPVLMMTTEGSAEMKARGKELGATGWIIKPFDPDKLPAILRKLL